jgi:ankyrin repeat protein
MVTSIYCRHYLPKAHKLMPRVRGGETALFWANNRDAVDLLVAKGANVNAKNGRNETALMQASRDPLM